MVTKRVAQVCKKNIVHKLGHRKKKSYIIYIITQRGNEKRGVKDRKRGEKDGKRGGEDGKRGGENGKRGGENGQRGKIKCADFASYTCSGRPRTTWEV